MCRILYRLLVSLARLAVRSGRSKDLEIIVLRHQLAVLHRQNNRPALADEDRALLDAIAARHGQQAEHKGRYPQAHPLACPAPPLTSANAVAGPHAVARLHQIRFAISEIRFTAQVPTLEDHCNFNDLGTYAPTPDLPSVTVSRGLIGIPEVLKFWRWNKTAPAS